MFRSPQRSAPEAASWQEEEGVQVQLRDGSLQPGQAGGQEERSQTGQGV